MKVIHEKCDPKAADDRQLPYTAYLIEYKVGGKSAYDIAMADSQVLLFDHYYDKYKKDFKRFDQTKGTVDPRRWRDKQKAAATPPRKTRKRKKSNEED